MYENKIKKKKVKSCREVYVKMENLCKRVHNTSTDVDGTSE